MESSTTEFLLIFSRAHPFFRRAEFESVLSLNGYHSAPKLSKSHFQILEFIDGQMIVQKLLNRCILLKFAYEIIFHSHSHAALVEGIKTQNHLFQQYNCSSQSWCIQIKSQIRKRDTKYLQNLIKMYGGALHLTEAPIDLENPQNIFTIFEIYDQNDGNIEEPKEVFLAKFIGEGQTKLKTKYALTKRHYIGNSTTDPELAFIQANLALIRPGTLALDPFCGTGGLLLSAAHFGAHVIGFEIKWDVAKAKGKSARANEQFLTKEQSVRANFQQYGLDDGRYLGIFLADSSQHGMWRMLKNDGEYDGIMDAITADPPYGIREKGQKLGTNGWKFKRKECFKAEENVEISINERSQPQKSYPEKQQYEMSKVFLDILDLGAKLLRLGGRLTFWFPICKSEYSEKILPKSAYLRLLYNCEQQLTRNSSRLLLVYEKVKHPILVEEQLQEKAYFEEDCYSEQTFREKIFNCRREDANEINI